jgi:hypothetical protein
MKTIDSVFIGAVHLPGVIFVVSLTHNWTNLDPSALLVDDGGEDGPGHRDSLSLASLKYLPKPKVRTTTFC